MVHLSSFLRTSTLKHLMGKQMLPLLTATRKWPSKIYKANYCDILITVFSVLTNRPIYNEYFFRNTSPPQLFCASCYRDSPSNSKSDFEGPS